MKAICLLSGGLDSTVVMYHAVHQKFDVHVLTLDYGQLHNIEIQKAKKTAALLKVQHNIISISLPWKGSALLDPAIAVPKNRVASEMMDIPDTYVPGRNTIFLSFAFSWAEAINAETVFIGANQIDYSGYPDCRGEYFQQFQHTCALGTKQGVEGREIKINTPLLNMTKKDIVLLGKKLNVPFENTWSCYTGGATPCAVCDACQLRKKGFDSAGVSDPLSSKV